MAISDIGVICGRLVYHFFNKVTQKPMETQKKVLGKLMDLNKDTEYGKKYDFANIHTLEEYQQKVPMTTFLDYSDYVDRMIAGEKNLITSLKVKRYASSSGSVGKPKMLPKTGKDLFNMQCMGLCGPMGCVYNYYKRQGKKLGPLRGPLVMVLTGHKLENGMMSNGAGQIPLSYIKPLTRWFSSTPVEIMYPEHEEKLNIVYLQLRFALEDTKVSFLGSVVVTLLTSMFEYLEENWQMLCDDIEKGTIDPSVKITPELRKKFEKRLKPNPKRAAELRAEFANGFDTPIAPRIWPRLKWVYGMVGSNLTVYLKKLRKWIGDDMPLHNMGYAAAEGFFAMPEDMNRMDYVLLPRSLIYEFLPVDADGEETEDAVPVFMDKLEVGKEYEMIVTNFSGLYRYRLYDVVKVTGIHNKTPMVEFVYRKNLGMDVSNEKTTTQMLDWTAENMSAKSGVPFEGHSFFGDYSVKPARYVMLVEPETPVDEAKRQELVALLDESMKEANEKYDKYRRWALIGDPDVRILKKGAYNAYREMLRSRGVVLNQIKPVTVINSKEREEFFFSQVEL